VANETGRKTPDGAYAMAAELLDKGESAAVVEQQLVGMGVSLETARRIVAEQHRATAAVAKSDGRNEMRFSAIAFGGGVLVLLVTGVSSYVGWFGMIGGGINFLRGLYKQRRSRQAGQ
jgi:hypothetical protein